MKIRPFGPVSKIPWRSYFGLIIICLALVGCATPGQNRPDFSVISSPQVPILAQSDEVVEIPTATETPSLAEPAEPAEPAESTPTGPSVFTMAPTQIPTSTPTPTPIPSDTPTSEPTPTSPAESAAAAPTTAPPRASTPPDEPRRGGSWDMEDGFEVWLNPWGDNCSGSVVAVGWQGFTSRGQYGSSCLYSNEYGPNVFSGRYSQQVTFDFADSSAGIYRGFDSQPEHRYQVKAILRHVHTLPAMQFFFGYDLSGGVNWEAETVQWVGWDEFREDDWITHEETFTATGPRTTIFIRGLHPTAAQGGATYIDGVEVLDLGQ